MKDTNTFFREMHALRNSRKYTAQYQWNIRNCMIRYVSHLMWTFWFQWGYYLVELFQFYNFSSSFFLHLTISIFFSLRNFFDLDVWLWNEDASNMKIDRIVKAISIFSISSIWKFVSISIFDKRGILYRLYSLYL